MNPADIRLVELVEEVNNSLKTIARMSITLEEIRDVMRREEQGRATHARKAV